MCNIKNIIFTSTIKCQEMSPPSLLHPLSLVPTDMAETLRYLLVGSGEITGESMEVKILIISMPEDDVWWLYFWLFHYSSWPVAHPMKYTRYSPLLGRPPFINQWLQFYFFFVSVQWADASSTKGRRVWNWGDYQFKTAHCNYCKLWWWWCVAQLLPVMWLPLQFQWEWQDNEQEWRPYGKVENRIIEVNSRLSSIASLSRTQLKYIDNYVAA